jgi:DNA-binding CsgD family transcriptional regulator
MAMTLLSLELRLVNYSLFPLFNDIFPAAREISTVFGILLMFLAALVSLRAPWTLGLRFLAPLAILLVVAGEALALLGVALDSSLLVLLGPCLRVVGDLWFFMLVGLALIGMKTEQGFYCLILALLLAALTESLLAFAPAAVSIALMFVSPLLIVWLAGDMAQPFLVQAASAPAPTELSITAPSSFLPLWHKLFIIILIFSAALGFSLTFRSEASNPPLVLLSFVPIALIALVSFVMRRRTNFDAIFTVCTLLVIAGYLAIIVTPLGFISPLLPLPNTLLAAGSDCFTLVFYSVLISIGRRNPLGAVPALLLGHAISSLGIIFGTSIGHLSNSAAPLGSPTESLPVVVLVFLIVAFCLIGIRDFSFERTIEGITPVMPIMPGTVPDTFTTSAHGSADHDFLEISCEHLVQLHSLTPREAEILELLARGRNGRAICDKLVLSRNTVKTHVRNIYAKLDVHSQQEIIDLVEYS